jgi:hypothetical protein
MKITMFLHCASPQHAEQISSYVITDAKDMSEYGWVFMHEVHYGFEPLDHATAAKMGILKLRSIQAKATEAFEKEMTKIEVQISKLQALEYSHD